MTTKPQTEFDAALDQLFGESSAQDSADSGSASRAFGEPVDDENYQSGERPVITCTCCGSTFPGFTPEQANGCASDLIGQDIWGHYGSFVADMDHYRFRLPHGYADGIVCDICIVALQREGAIEGPPISEEVAAYALAQTEYIEKRERS